MAPFFFLWEGIFSLFLLVLLFIFFLSPSGVCVCVCTDPPFFKNSMLDQEFCMK